MLKYKVPNMEGKGRVFSYMMFFYMLGSAIVSPVFPEYLERITGSESYVGILISLAALVALVFSLLISRVLHKISRMVLLYIGLFGMAIVYLLYFFADQTWTLFVLQILRGLLVAGLFVVIPLMVRDFTDKKSLAHEEGVYYWFVNLAWILGPIAGGVAAYFFGINCVFIIAMLVMSFAMFFLKHEHVVDVGEKENEERLGVFVSLRKFFEKCELLKAYLIAFGLYLWFAVATMCVPLYMVEYGFSEIVIGIVVSLKLLPFLFLEGWVGNNARDGNMGRFVKTGFLIMFLALLLAAVVGNVYFSLLMFFVVSIGAALVEPLKETYLFKHLSKSDENDLYPIYSTARQIGFLMGPLAAGFTIVAFGYEVLFLLMAFSLLPMVLVGYLIHKE